MCGWWWVIRQKDAHTASRSKKRLPEKPSCERARNADLKPKVVLLLFSSGYEKERAQTSHLDLFYQNSSSLELQDPRASATAARRSGTIKTNI